MRLTHTDGLYFTVTVLSTVGFGDITAKTQAARLVVTGQMIADLVILALAIKIIVGAVSRGRQPGDAGSGQPAGNDPPLAATRLQAPNTWGSCPAAKAAQKVFTGLYPGDPPLSRLLSSDSGFTGLPSARHAHTLAIGDEPPARGCAAAHLRSGDQCEQECGDEGAQGVPERRVGAEPALEPG